MLAKLSTHRLTTLASCSLVGARRGFAVGLPSEIRRKTVVLANGSPKSERGKVDYPPLSGASEIHIFLAPINPDEATVKKYDAAVAAWNAKHWDDEATRRRGASTQMRPVYLCLDFRSQGPTFVCQSARHVTSNDPELVVQEAFEDAEHFASHGFDVIRRKVEAYGYTKGVPATDDEAAQYPDKYFEFHLRVNRKEDAPSVKITKSEVSELLALSREYTERWGVPVPLSYNAYKEGRQRFLNLRVGHCGRETALQSINQIKADIDAHPALKYLEVGKSHIEYVWWDDNRDMDRGWIDFTQEEFTSVLGLME
mmetsp:Transcript_51618/g.95548  ORF Transcript_51618/g.95548 Transcript_51618/m.95548 type:complete len:311 (+) Transcript_51618:43-975(+)